MLKAGSSDKATQTCATQSIARPIVSPSRRPEKNSMPIAKKGMYRAMKPPCISAEMTRGVLLAKNSTSVNSTRPRTRADLANMSI